MSKELVRKLRWRGDRGDATCIEAADRIEELEREVAGVKSLMQAEQSVAVWALKERDALQADNARLREALELIAGTDSLEAALDPQRAVRVARNALTATPEQSLARHDNRIKEECAGICDRFGERQMHPTECAAAIRATKGQE